METFLKLIKGILDKATFKRVMSVGLLVVILLSGYIVYLQSADISRAIFGSGKVPPFTTIPIVSETAIGVFMKKHKEVAYLTVLTFQFEKNTRLPIYRAFNNDEIKKIIYEKLNGGDGALPIFLKDDQSNNNQIIAIIGGQTFCEPFTGGGLSRVWPDLVSKFHTSCRTPLPPVFGSALRGYIVAHINGKTLTPYEIDVLKLDLILLSKTINDQTD